MVVADGVADPTVRVIDRHLRSSAAGPAPIRAKIRRRQEGLAQAGKIVAFTDQVRAADFQQEGRCNQRSDCVCCL